MGSRGSISSSRASRRGSDSSRKARQVSANHLRSNTTQRGSEGQQLLLVNLCNSKIVTLNLENKIVLVIQCHSKQSKARQAILAPRHIKIDQRDLLGTQAVLGNPLHSRTSLQGSDSNRSSNNNNSLSKAHQWDLGNNHSYNSNRSLQGLSNSNSLSKAHQWDSDNNNNNNLSKAHQWDSDSSKQVPTLLASALLLRAERLHNNSLGAVAAVHKMSVLRLDLAVLTCRRIRQPPQDLVPVQPADLAHPTSGLGHKSRASRELSHLQGSRPPLRRPLDSARRPCRQQPQDLALRAQRQSRGLMPLLNQVRDLVLRRQRRALDSVRPRRRLQVSVLLQRRRTPDLVPLSEVLTLTLPLKRARALAPLLSRLRVLTLRQ